MKHYKCNVCNEIICEDELIYNKYKGCYDVDYGVYSPSQPCSYYEEQKNACPYCRSEDLERVNKCKICGEIYKEHNEDLLICNECLDTYGTKIIYDSLYPKLILSDGNVVDLSE